jgi:hypothetical protein
MSYRTDAGPSAAEEMDDLERRIHKLISEFKFSKRVTELENILRAAELQLDGPEAVETQRQLLAMQNHLKLLAGAVFDNPQPEPIELVKDGAWICCNDMVMVDPFETAKLKLQSEQNSHLLPRAIRFSVEDAGVTGKSEQHKIRLLSVEIQRSSQLDKWRSEKEENPLYNSQSTAILGLGRLMKINWAVLGAMPSEACEIVVYNPRPMTMCVEAEIFGESLIPGIHGNFPSGWSSR